MQFRAVVGKILAHLAGDGIERKPVGGHHVLDVLVGGFADLYQVARGKQ